MHYQTRLKHLHGASSAVGLTVYLNSPGSGIPVRYRFSTQSESDYHGAKVTYTALGIMEAEAFINGYRIGKHSKR